MPLLRLVVTTVFSVTVAAGAAGAQVVGINPHPRPDTTIAPTRNAGFVRFSGAMAGAFLGAIAGAYVGYSVLPHDCGCDDPGLDALIWGGLGGTVVGAAFGAAAANLKSECDFAGRLKRTLIGSAIGGAAAYFVAGGSSNEGTVIAVPASAVGGSLAALGRCWRVHP